MKGSNWSAACLIVFCAACGSSGLGQPIAQFPSREALYEATSSEAYAASTLKVTSVDRWEMQLQSPSDSGYPNTTIWDQLLLKKASSSGQAQPSAELRCAAEEAARFYTQYEAYPDRALQRYLLARCGSTLPGASLSAVEIQVKEESPELIRQALGDSLDKLVDSLVERPKALVGLGFAQGNGRATVVGYSGVELIKLNRFSPLVTGNSATLKGRAAHDVEAVLGLVNHGQYGVRMCESDLRVKAPHFSLKCPISAEDEVVEIEVATRAKGRVLLNMDARAQVRKNEEAGLLYELTRYGDPGEVENAEAFQRAVLKQLNAVRRHAGIRPVRLAPKQSSTNERVAPHYLAAAVEGNEDFIDLIALGVLAGWDVRGLIKDGGVYSAFSSGGLDPTRWLSQALALPSGRWALLDPESSRIAIGARVLKPIGLTALVTTYSFFESGDHAQDEDALFERLARARSAFGVAAPTRIPKGRALQKALDQINKNELSPGEALDQALEGISSAQRRSVSGWIVETHDLDHISFDDSMVRSDSLEVQVGVTHYRAPGGAWGQYVALVVVLGSDGRTIQAQTHPERFAL